MTELEIEMTTSINEEQRMFDPEFDPREELDDREPEPPGDEESPRFDVEAARKALAALHEESCVLGPNGRAALDALPAALDEVEALRQELAYWRSLPIGEEYAVTEGEDESPDEAEGHMKCSSLAEAEMFAGESGHVWAQSLTKHGWQHLDKQPPF